MELWRIFIDIVCWISMKIIYYFDSYLFCYQQASKVPRSGGHYRKAPRVLHSLCAITATDTTGPKWTKFAKPADQWTWRWKEHSRSSLKDVCGDQLVSIKVNKMSHVHSLLKPRITNISCKSYLKEVIQNILIQGENIGTLEKPFNGYNCQDFLLCLM